MSRIVQEKFQVVVPQKPEGTEGGGWVSDGSARDKRRIHTRNATGRFENVRGDLYNSLPPGSNIEDQEVADFHGQPMAAGLGSGTQVTQDVTRQSLRSGFDRKKLRPTDDEYTRQHNDCFYDEVTVDGVTGFVERNNMLDRL